MRLGCCIMMGTLALLAACAAPSAIPPAAIPASASAVTLAPNPMLGDRIWGPLLIGMSVEEVLAALPNSKYDGNWSSLGVVGAMGEAGIAATNRIKVTAAVRSPYGTTATLYALFDAGRHLDGVVIATTRQNWPAEASANHGFIGFNIAEYKEAAKVLISRAAVAELGQRVGAPRLAREQMAPIGSVGIASATSRRSAVGIAVQLGGMSPSTIVQQYQRGGYRSFLAIHTVRDDSLGTYLGGVAFVVIQAVREDEIPDVEG